MRREPLVSVAYQHSRIKRPLEDEIGADTDCPCGESAASAARRKGMNDGKFLGRAISLWPVVPQTLPHIPKSETPRSQPADHSAAFPPNREKTLKIHSNFTGTGRLFFTGSLHLKRGRIDAKKDRGPLVLPVGPPPPSFILTNRPSSLIVSGSTFDPYSAGRPSYANLGPLKIPPKYPLFYDSHSTELIRSAS